MKKTLFIALIVLCFVFITSCQDDNNSNDDDDIAYAYCSEYYNASYGEIGFFSISVIDENKLEKDFSDLSKLTLSGAFSGMEVKNISLNEDGISVNVYVSGSLNSGNTGYIEGFGIVKNQNIKVTVPITEASASSNSIIYDNVDEQQIEIELSNACFKKELTKDDFILSGAAGSMEIINVSSDYYEDEGEIILSQTAVITLKGEPDGTNFAYIDILDTATTYNEDLRVVLNTDFYGGIVINECVNTFKTYDIIYVESNNITFNSEINASDISFEGALKDYATIKDINVIKENLIALSVSFPYTNVKPYDNIGYIKFNAETNYEKIEFECSTIVGNPSIECNLEIDNNLVNITIELNNGEFNLLDMYPFNVYYSGGEEIMVSDIEIVNLDGYLNVSFKLPELSSEILYFELQNAYSIINEEGISENITVMFYFNV